MGQSWDELERAALELLRERFIGIETWPPHQFQLMLAMALKRVRKERGYGGQSVETEGQSH